MYFRDSCVHPLVRFIQYNPTSLERSHRHELLTEVDLGVPINLILPETYTSHHGTSGVLRVANVESGMRLAI